TVQAGVALDALDSRPELARQALRQVRESGREAVRELRATVSVLRDDRTPDGCPGTEPAPRLDQLPALVEWVREAGVRVSLRWEPGTGTNGTAAPDGPPPTAAAGTADTRDRSGTDTRDRTGTDARDGSGTDARTDTGIGTDV